MKVLICSPYTGVVGGIARWTRHISEYAATEPVTLEHIDFARTRSGQTLRFPLLKGVYALYDYMKLIRRAVSSIRTTRCDVLHITTPASFLLLKDLILLRAARRKGLRTIVHFHFGRIPDLYRMRNWEQKLLDQVIRRADRVVVIDKASYDTLLSNGYDNVNLLPNPLTPAVSSIIEANGDVVRQDRKLLFAGHVIETKGVFELIDACKGLDGLKLKLIGAVSDEMRMKLRRRAGNGCEAWLEIAGELDFEATIKEMLSAGVFVLPTYTEGFPNVIIESMACGCPIVTTDVGAIPEMLDTEHGFNYGICVKPRDVEQLRSAVRKMLDDREYASMCGRNAQQRVKMLYAMPQVWKQLATIWETV